MVGREILRVPFSGVDMLFNYENICRKFLFPIADFFIGTKVMYYYEFYQKSQWLDFNKLISFQNDNLVKTINVAYREVPFYKRLYDRLDVDINSVKTVRDLHLLPQVFKKDLKSHYPNGCVRSTGLKWKEFCTSGSSGNPFAVRIDNDSLSRAQAFMLLRANFSGWRIGDRCLQTGMTLKRGIIKKLKDVILLVDYVSAFDLSDVKLDMFLNAIKLKEIKFIMGYASSIYCLAKRARLKGDFHNIEGVVTWGDNLFAHYRKEIEEVFGCRVTDTYGCGEGIQIGAQCGRKDGFYHIFMPHVAVEIVDDEGNPVPDGTLGHVLLTRLDPGMMPLVRYRVGDLGIKSRDKACSCGRGFEMLERIEGRDTDIVMTPSGKKLIVHFFTGIIEYYTSIETFKVVQNEIKRIELSLVVNERFCDEDLTRLLREIAQKGDPKLIVDTKIVQEIPLEKSNKRRFVVSNLSDNIRLI